MTDLKVLTNIETYNYIKKIEDLFDVCNYDELQNSLNSFIKNPDIRYKLDKNLKRILNTFIRKILYKKKLSNIEKQIIISIIDFLKTNPEKKKLICYNILVEIIDKTYLYTPLNNDRNDIIEYISSNNNTTNSLLKNYINLYSNKTVNPRYIASNNTGSNSSNFIQENILEKEKRDNFKAEQNAEKEEEFEEEVNEEEEYGNFKRSPQKNNIVKWINNDGNPMSAILISNTLNENSKIPIKNAKKNSSGIIDSTLTFLDPNAKNIKFISKQQDNTQKEDNVRQKAQNELAKKEANKKAQNELAKQQSPVKKYKKITQINPIVDLSSQTPNKSLVTTFRNIQKQNAGLPVVASSYNKAKQLLLKTSRSFTVKKAKSLELNQNNFINAPLFSDLTPEEQNNMFRQNN